MHRLRTCLVAAVAVAMVVGYCASPAGATNQTSTRFAEMRGTSAGYTTATARFRVPDFSCPGDSTTPAANHGVMFRSADGSPKFAVAIFAVSIRCSMGSITPSYDSFLTENDASGNSTKEIPVSAGDLLGVTLRYNPTSGLLRLVAKNLTTDTNVGDYSNIKGVVFTTVEYLFDKPSSSIPAFTTAQFSGLTIDGAPAASKLTTTAYDLVNGPNVLVKTLPFDASGERFRLKFVASS